MGYVALIGENSCGYVNILLNIWNNGDCAVLIDWKIPSATATQMMNEIGVCECFISERLFKEKDYLNCFKIHFYTYKDNDMSACLLGEEISRQYCVSYLKKDAVVIYSSGTTGKSKGVVLSHFAITTNADAIIDYMQPTIHDCIYTIRPLSHSSTLVGELLVALRTGCRFLLAPTIVPPRYISKNISNFGVTILGVNPRLLSLLSDEYKRHNTDRSSLRSIYSSGSILNQNILSKAKDVFREADIFNVYGLTEAGPRVSAQRNGCRGSNSVGKPIKGVEIAVVDESGNVLNIGERGYIHVNTSSRYSRYIVGKEKQPSLYKDWLNTGDIGYIDEYKELYIVDRADDLIFLGTHKIYPSEVVSQLYKFATLDDCVVTKIFNDETEILCCIYSAKEDIGKDIVKKLGTVLVNYEIPKMFIKTESIPKTYNGKYSMFQIRELIEKTLERKNTNVFRLD